MDGPPLAEDIQNYAQNIVDTASPSSSPWRPAWSAARVGRYRCIDVGFD